jgi:UDP-2,3-diacylglucosamine hydrolase
MIGLIFGDTDFPIEILKAIKKRKIKYLIIDLSKSKKFKKNKKSYAVSLGQFGKIINILEKNNCKKVLFAGKVNKPNFSKLKLDLKGIYYIPRIITASKLGDAAVLKEIIKIFAQNKIKTENSLKFNPELSLKKDNYSKVKPNKQDQLDIKKAIKILNNLRQYNFSQGVVVRNQNVVAIEGKGGTKKMLEKSRSKKFRHHGVLVKFPKKKQDLRVDLPTIGLETLKQSKTAGLKGIVIKNKKHVFLDKNKCIKFANKNKMFISVK